MQRKRRKVRKEETQSSQRIKWKLDNGIFAKYSKEFSLNPNINIPWRPLCVPSLRTLRYPSSRSLRTTFSARCIPPWHPIRERPIISFEFKKKTCQNELTGFL